MSITVQIEDFQVGMELAIPVKNNYNQTLLPANTVLEEKHRQILQTWGIQEFRIVEKAGITEQMRATEDYVKIKLGKRLTWEPRNSHEEELLRIAAGHSIKN